MDDTARILEHTAAMLSFIGFTRVQRRSKALSAFGYAQPMSGCARAKRSSPKTFDMSNTPTRHPSVATTPC